VARVACSLPDLTPECCLKQNPGQWERCTGSSEAARAHSLAFKTTAIGVAGGLAVQAVHIGSAERRGVELVADLLAKVEKAIVRCVRRADQQVNDHHFNGKSPSRELCQQVKVGERTTWAVYLGLFKHEQAWPCLREALEALVPGRYLLHPRFQLNARTGKWEYLNENEVSQIVTQEGWSGLRGTIEPDIILLDENGVVVHVYDLKFPCPKTNVANWEWYREGSGKEGSQGELYKRALGVTPKLVSPQEGVVPKMK
jgi:hypothetical protein